jgi:CarD family transcriptional regulator
MTTAPKKKVISKVAPKEKEKEVKEKPAPNYNFKVGDNAVYPAHGVGKIEAIESKNIMGDKKDFYVINILNTGMNVLVPVENIKNVGLRPVISASKVKDVFTILKEKKRTIVSATWNRRYREYMEKIKSGSIFEIAEVLRDLVVLKKEKELSFGERKMLDTARNLILKEITIAKGADENKISDELTKIFSEL